VADHFSASIAGFADWLPFNGRRKVASTIEQYTDSAQRLAAWAREQGRTTFAELTKADLRAFLGSLHGRYGGPPSEAFRATVWWGIRSLFRYLADEEDCKDLAASITIGRPPDSDHVTHLDADEIDALLKACTDPRDLAVISVALDSGLRIAELASLQVQDVVVDDLRARRILVRGKGSKLRVVIIGTRTAVALRRYLRQRARSPHAGLPDLWLGQRGAMTVNGLDKLVRAAGERAGLEGLHMHALRHSWAHFYRLDGGSVDNLAVLAGWSGVQMAMKYGRSAQAERAEQEAMGLSLVDRQRPRRA
jgi:integrase